MKIRTISKQLLMQEEAHGQSQASAMYKWKTKKSVLSTVKAVLCGTRAVPVWLRVATR